MNLREQLKEILPKILPTSPSEAIKGTELIRVVKEYLKQDYSDATLRYHFSIMCCDPTSPIAKVEHGQGYYLRPIQSYDQIAYPQVIQGQFGGEFGGANRAHDVVMTRMGKFRALYALFHDYESRYPVLFERAPANPPLQNAWSYPDAALLQWEVGAEVGDGFELSRELLDLRKHLGGEPFLLTAAKLIPEISHQTCRRDFFQCLSACNWAHNAELAIAGPVEDEQLAEDLRKLGTEYGVGVTIYGLSISDLDDLPDPSSIERSTAQQEKDALYNTVSFRRLTTPKRRTSLDWSYISQAMQDSGDLHDVVEWIGRCVADCQAYQFSDFRALEDILEKSTTSALTAG